MRGFLLRCGPVRFALIIVPNVGVSGPKVFSAMKLMEEKDYDIEARSDPRGHAN
jgi:hypothetical protein